MRDPCVLFHCSYGLVYGTRIVDPTFKAYYPEVEVIDGINWRQETKLVPGAFRGKFLVLIHQVKFIDPERVFLEP